VVRINQFLARAGLGSRRKVEALVLSGLVKVNGSEINDLAINIDPDNDVVEYDEKTVILPEKKYYLLNKPVGYTTTKSDPHAEKTVFELLPEDDSLIAVGRLDRDTTGLLIFTNDGDFAQRLIHPSKKIEKVYVAKLENEISETDLRRLEEGIVLDDGLAKFSYTKKVAQKTVELGILEGRNRIVRRMFEGVGNKVVELARIKIGDICCDVERGEYRELTDSEVKSYA
jgi:23S rRNA pseudouridine2605 synthase